MATKTIITCDRCKKECKDDTNGHTWLSEYPVHLVRLGFETHPDSWTGTGNNGPPIEFNGVTIGELCDRCFIDFKNFIRDNWNTESNLRSSEAKK